MNDLTNARLQKAIHRIEVVAGRLEALLASPPGLAAGANPAAPTPADKEAVESAEKLIRDRKHELQRAMGLVDWGE